MTRPGCDRRHKRAIGSRALKPCLRVQSSRSFALHQMTRVPRRTVRAPRTLRFDSRNMFCFRSRVFTDVQNRWTATLLRHFPTWSSVSAAGSASALAAIALRVWRRSMARKSRCRSYWIGWRQTVRTASTVSPESIRRTASRGLSISTIRDRRRTFRQLLVEES